MRVCNRWTAGEIVGVLGALVEDELAGFAGGPAVSVGEVVPNPAAGALNKPATLSRTAKSRRATDRRRGIARIVAPAKTLAVLE